MVCVGRKAQILARRGMDHPGRKPSFQPQGVQPGVDQGGEYFPQPRTAQRGNVLIPTAVLPMMQAFSTLQWLRNTRSSSSGPHRWWLASLGIQAGQQIPALSTHLPSGYIHPPLLHHLPLQRPGKSQLIPDIVGQRRISPDPPPLDHTRFSPGSPPAAPPVPPGQIRLPIPPAPQVGSP